MNKRALIVVAATGRNEGPIGRLLSGGEAASGRPLVRPEADSPPSPRASTAFLLGWIVLLVAFSPTAFRVDEPNILAIARAIGRDALDPYGFVINWTGEPLPAFKVLSNPPGLPYWLAGWARLFGWSEVSLHLACIPFSVLALVSFAVMARQSAIPGPMAMALLAGSPAFLIGSQVIMPDVPMLSMLIGSVALALVYRRSGSKPAAVAAFCLAALCPLFKYNGIILVPVLSVVALLAERRKLGLLVIATSPALGLLVWSIGSWAVYGDAHFLATARFQAGADVDVVTALLPILGIGVLPLAQVLAPRPLELKRPQEILFLITSFLIWVASGYWLLSYPWTVAVGFAVACTLGLRFLLYALLCSISAVRRRDGWIIAISIWIALTLILQFRVLFSATRYVLPLLPAALLILFHRASGSRILPIVSIAGVLLAVAIGIGDARAANASRTFIDSELRPLTQRSPRSFFFDGHWGFQHYAERMGGRILAKSEKVAWRPGDVVAIAFNSYPSRRHPEGDMSWREIRRNVNIRWPVHTIDCSTATSFYSNGVPYCRWPTTSYLPWSFSLAPSERFAIWIAEAPN